MSNVQILNVTYTSIQNENRAASESSDVQNEFRGSIPNRFLVKFQKPEIPMPDLFSVEGEFYRLVDALAEKTMSSSEDAGGIILSTLSLPFRLVDAIATGKSWLLLQYVPPDRVKTIDVTSGCPPDKFDELMTRLARLHTCFWIRPEQGETLENLRLSSILKDRSGTLSATPGVGHNLPIEDRQASFANSWPAVRKRLLPFFRSESREYLQQLDKIVKWTAQSHRIENITNSVGEKKLTLIHGDFHVGNMLFPKLSSHEGKVWCADRNTGHNKINDGAASSRPWLVDWSMSGIGNPLIDLVFFLVVGADVIPSNAHPDTDPVATTSKNLEKVLCQYHRTLNSSSWANSETRNEPFLGSELSSLLGPSLLSRDEMVSMFRQCLLNQFVILVCYDDLCRSLAEASPDKESKELLHSHFDRVNVRCVNMLLSEFGWREDIIL